MRIQIVFKCDNAAFEDLEQETARVLRRLADKAESNIERLRDSAIMDANGNRIGRATIEDEDEDENAIRQTACAICGQDIEGETGGAIWRDRGGNQECPPYAVRGEIIRPPAGTFHTPTED